MSTKKNKKPLSRFLGAVKDVYGNQIAEECEDFSNIHPGRELPSDLPNKKIRGENNRKHSSKEW